MLQQTQYGGDPYFERFMVRFPRCGVGRSTPDRSSHCGRGWATTPARATCMRPRNGAWNSTMANCRATTSRYAHSPALAAVLPAQSWRRPGANPSRSWTATSSACCAACMASMGGRGCRRSNASYGRWRTPLPQARLPITAGANGFRRDLCTRFDPSCVLCPLQTGCIALREGVFGTAYAKTRQALPERKAIVMLLRDREGRVLLQRRPPAGVWAALWSLPEAEDHAAARIWLEQHLDSDYDQAEALAVIPHGFTHYRLQLQPLRWCDVALRAMVRDNDDLRG